MKFSADGTHLVDQIVANPENVFTWTAKPIASEFIGSAWFSDIGAMGYSDGVSWSILGEKSIKKTNGIVIADFPSGTASLVSSTPGAGATVSTPESGKGIRISTVSGQNLNTTLTFDVAPYMINADTMIGVLFYMLDPAKTDQVLMYVTTQASNFGSYCQANSIKKPYSSAVPLGGGLVYMQWRGDYITATPAGSGAVTVNTIINRMRLAIKMTQGQVVELLELHINASVKPMFPIYFDDGHYTQFTEAFNYMSKKDLVGTIGVVGSFIGNGFSLSLAQCQEMYDAGWDMINHSYTHFGVNTAYGGTAPTEICLSQTVLAGASFVLNGSVGSATFTTPRCLVFTHTADDSLKRISVNYLDADGIEHTEIIIGGNGATTSYLTNACTKVIDIVAIDAISSSVKVGLSASYDEIYADLLANKNWLNNNGFTRGLDCYIAPGGQTNAILYDVLSDLGITKMRTILSHYSNPFVCPAPLSLPSVGNGITTGDSATIIAVKDLIKQRWLTSSMYLHEIVADSASPTAGQARIADFRLVIDSIATDVANGDLICPAMSQACRLSGY